MRMPVVVGRKPLPSSAQRMRPPAHSVCLPALGRNTISMLQKKEERRLSGGRWPARTAPLFLVPDLHHRSRANGPANAWRCEIEDRTTHSPTDCPSPSATEFDMYLQYRGSSAGARHGASPGSRSVLEAAAASPGHTLGGQRRPEFCHGRALLSQRG